MELYAGDTIKARYDKMAATRHPYLIRGRECALYTIPTLFPPEGANGTYKFPTPYQSIGARGVNTLAAKLLLTLLPPNSPFFRYVLSDAIMAELTGRDDIRGDIESDLSKMEREIMSEVETSALRSPVFDALKLLIISGNVLLFDPDGNKAKFKFFRLDRYVVDRDPMGQLREVITYEDVAPEDVPEQYRELAQRPSPGSSHAEKQVPLYTRACLKDGTWTIEQEIGGRIIPTSTFTRPEDRCPFLALRFIQVNGEDYGRGYVEEYIGDLKSLEGLMKAIVMGSAAAAKVLFLVKPNGVTSHKMLAESETGSIREGNAEDVSVLQMDKYADFRVAKETIDSLKESLSFAFMLNTAIQRNGERVTAEEIRYMANELESSLGGIYSSLAQEFQLPLLKLIESRLQKQGRIPKLPGVQPVAITGMEAIGRGQDRVKLSGFITDITNTIGPEQAAPYLNISEFIKRMGVSWSVDMKGLINDQATIDAQNQKAQMMAMMEKLGPNAVTQLGGMAKQHMANQASEAAPPAPSGTQ